MSPATPVPARIAWKVVRTVLSTGPGIDGRDVAASSETGRLALTAGCIRKDCGRPLATIEIGYRHPGGSGRVRILAASPSVPGAWTDQSGGHQVTHGLVHAVHLPPGFAKGHDRIWVLTERALRHTRSQSRRGYHRVDAPSTMPARDMHRTQSREGRTGFRSGSMRDDPDPHGPETPLLVVRGQLDSKFPVLIRCSCTQLVSVSLPTACGPACDWHRAVAPFPAEPVSW